MHSQRRTGTRRLLGTGSVGIVLALGLLVAGCGGDDSNGGSSGNGGSEAKQLDTAALEESIKSQAQPSGASGTAAGPTVKRVSCPATVPAKANSQFDCKATGTNGLTGIVNVQLQNAQGTSYSYKGKLKTSDGFTQTLEGSTTVE